MTRAAAALEPTASSSSAARCSSAKRQARADAEQPERLCVGGGVTHDDDGSGIADAVALLSRKGIISGQAPVLPGEPTLPLSTITDATGGWQLDAVDPGRYRVSAPRSASSPATNEVRIAGRSEQIGINLAMISGGASTVPAIFGRCSAMSTNIFSSALWTWRIDRHGRVTRGRDRIVMRQQCHARLAVELSGKLCSLELASVLA